MAKIKFDEEATPEESISKALYCEVRPTRCTCGYSGACPNMKLYKPVKEVKEPVIKERKPRKIKDE